MKFKVCGEATIRHDVEVEASSYEEAVMRACEVLALWTPQNMDLRPTWVGTKEHSDSHGEYEFEVIGPCGWCKTPLITRDIPGQPWNYDSDPENEHGDLVCYPCIKSKGYIDSEGNITKTWR